MTTEKSSPVAGREKYPVLSVFTSHWLAMVGLGLVLTAVVMWLVLVTVHLRQGGDNPYIGVAMMVAAGVLALGAAITPIGLYFGRRRLRQKLVAVDRATAWRRMMVFLIVTSALNAVVLSQSATRAVHFLESKKFCLTCHVHEDMARSFDQGPHAGILCVDCHVGNGALGFIESKLQGTKQLWAVMTDSVPVPIETAIERGLMIPSEETCEECHWKEQPANAKLRLIQRYAEDATNTPETTLLTMNVGGRTQGGIHGAHHGEGVEIRFVAKDPARQDIPLVEYTNTKTKVTRTWVKTGVNASSLSASPRITMQCFDCHNRPAHAFDMPDRAVDKALMLGRMSASLPFLKKTAVGILKTKYASSEEAATKIPAALASYYQANHPQITSTRAGDITEAGKVLADIYSRNVFPALGVDWGTYPDNRGHQSFPGCFRCHDGEHKDASGQEITNNCFSCHFPSAVGETNPKVLELLGADRLLRGLEKK
jgi:nitrate/TMAO reductase-like tetraheme cytochrome c subunit